MENKKYSKLKAAFEKEVDKRRYKKTAEKLYSQGLEAFADGLWESAFELFEKALKYWENSFKNTGNKQTLWTLYQKSNEFGVMYFREGRKTESEFFLQAAKKYAAKEIFGTNGAANRKAMEMAEQNLSVVLNSL